MVDTTEGAAVTGGRVQRRRERHRHQMLDIAEELFASMPYGSVRVEDIADRADVAVGTVYTHFGNKDGLFLAVAERALDRAVQRVELGLAGLHSPIDRMVAVGDAYLNLLLEFPSLTRFLVSPATLPGSEEVQERVRSRVQLLYDGLAGEIAAGIDAGLVRQVDPQRLAVFLIGSWCGVLAVGSNSATPSLPSTEARAVVQDGAAVLLRGLLLASAE